MKPKTMILLGLAVTCGLGASYMTSRLLADRGETEKETVKVLVAKRPLSIGEPIRRPEDLFEEKIIPKESDTPDAIRDYDALKDKVLKQSRNKGEVVTPANLLGKHETLDVPDNHEAVGLRTSLETSASGLATLPGSRVNLIWFQRGANNETSRSDYLLEDVLVLAADGKVDREGLTAVAQVVTLALTREQSVRVNLAKETGIINLTLRKHGDPTKQYIKGIEGNDLRKEIAERNHGQEKIEVKDLFKIELPTRDEKKAPVNLPEIAAKAKDPAPQAAEPAAPPKTYKREFTIIQNDRVEHIVREFAEDGTLLNETRRLSELTPQQPAPNNPAKSKKGPSLDI